MAAASCAERDRRERRRTALQERLEKAEGDARRIIAHIAEAHRPRRILQWGSLVHTERFSEISDIDIAVEGLPDGESALSAIRDAAESMSRFHLDIVELERVEPGRAELIRRFGRVAWSREDGG